ncbi:helicase HerA domain-containing protein [Enterococcus faecalis]
MSFPVGGNSFFNKHIAIVGSTGSGKSHSVVKIIQGAIDSKENSYDGLNNVHIVIFDLHSE